MISSFPGPTTNLASPPVRSPGRPITLRQRWFGNRSTLFLAFMAVGLVASIATALSPNVQWEAVIRHLFIFLGIPLSSGFDARVRAIPTLLLAVWLGVWAALSWPLVLAVGVIVMLLQYFHDRATEQLDEQAKIQTRAELQPLVRRLMAMKIGNAVALAPAAASLAAQGLTDSGVPVGRELLILATGGLIYGYLMYRHIRDFQDSVVGRPA